MEENRNDSPLIHGDSNVVKELNNTHVTNNITYVGKAAEEVQFNERKAEYRKRCERLIEGGVISRRARNELDIIAERLGIDAETKRDIESQIKNISARQAADIIGPVERMILDDAIDMVRSNSSGIRNSLHKLEALAEADDDEVQFYYHLLLVCENPTGYIRRYENRDSDTYWQTFWAYIAYRKNNAAANAEKQFHELSRYPSYPAGNAKLLDCAGWLFPTANGTTEEQIRMARKALNISSSFGISDLLNPFMNALVELIGQGSGVRQLTGNPETDFYLSRLFSVRPMDNAKRPGTYSTPVSGPVVSDEAVKVIDTANRQAVMQDAVKVAARTDAPKPSVQTDVTGRTAGKSSSLLMPLLGGAISLACMAGGYFGVKALFFPDKEQTVVQSPAPSQPKTAGQDTETTANAKAVSAPAAKASKPQNTRKQTAAAPATKPSVPENTAKPVAPKQKSAGEMSAAEAGSVGKGYVSSGNYSKAAEYLKSAADRGDAAANYEMALLYQNGSGVSRNLTSAFVYMKKAADAGYAKAFRPLGEMYHGGRGVAKDRTVAAQWYQKAADNGDAQARRLLNNM